ncbi:hypothetical protein L861_13860 [Litchfieldella anticariensis FP35 = DSM 16096]|uniref:Shikimate dehydrogenase substrate binding N-terminal domain-containing protein n=1 Tax=Litchfieldella anticariensis (strain DSM 16096 / CECT 5854 / CIP 108499 / LMG 22089 / FP35) TaxID=1121939 RepID=S2KER5_LITA3|nr:hypothetical protein [Halomonas anticariensis]EPC00355.1 hypothetical protein L861_13860 [Halomonas anticariensis FP35 = DSM 16096]
MESSNVSMVGREPHFLNGATRICAIVGDPIDQAGSPERFNRRYQKLGVNAVLIPLHVAPEDLTAVVKSLRAVRNFQGLVITVPHKQQALRLLDHCTPRAKRIGAVNAIRFTQGRLYGDNFDGEGFARGLAASGCLVRGKRVMIIGAGGAGHAIADAIAEHGAGSIGVHDWDRHRAEHLVANLRSGWPGFDAEPVDNDPAGFDVVINASPAGGNVDHAFPTDPARIGAGAHVADILLKPRITAFLTACEAKGLGVMPGYLMLDNQIEAIAEFFDASPAEMAGS